MRRFFSVPKHILNLMGKKTFTILCSKKCLSKPVMNMFNFQVTSGKKTKVMGVLDIYGFEVFKVMTLSFLIWINSFGKIGSMCIFVRN